METPKTLSGSPCKLCKAKGSPCHLHGGSPRKESKKSLSPQFTHFSELPMPVLYEILLKMKPSELKSLLRVPRVSSIIRLAEFKRLYDIKHKVNSFTLGKKYVEGANLIIKASDGLSLEFFEIGMGEGIAVTISGDKSLKNTRNINLHLSFDFTEEGIEFGIVDGKYNGFSWLQEFDDPIWKLQENEESNALAENRVLKQLRQILKMRHKLEWLPAYDEDGELQIPQNVPREIFETLKAIMNKHGFAENILWPQ